MRHINLRILVAALATFSLFLSLALPLHADGESTEPVSAPKTESPKADVPKTADPETGAPEVEATKPEAPKTDSPTPEAVENSKPDKEKVEADDEPVVETNNKVVKEFKRIKTRLQSQIRSTKADISVPAVEEVVKFPCFEAGKFLFNQGKDLPCHDARQTALSGMLKLLDEEGVRKMVMRSAESMLKPLSGKSGKPSPDAVYALVILLAGPEQLDEDTQSLMDKLEASPAWPALFIPMADMLGPCGGPHAAAVLNKLTKTKNFADDYGYRRAVVQNLAFVREKAAIPTLIELLSGVRGQIHSDILAYLQAISLEKFTKKHQWLDWWEDEKEVFEFPNFDEIDLRPQVVLTAGPGVVGAGGNQGANYYGVPIHGTRMVFVMDTSGSMRGPRIDAAKRELMKTISQLPDGIHFNVLVFDVNVRPWQKIMTVSSPESRNDAAAYVFKQELGNGTASYDALEAAMKYDTEAIFFLTDGAPFGGRITQPAKIVQEVTKANRRRRISVHALGIGAGMTGSDMDVFLATLAGQNWGVYRRVDE